MPRDLSMLQAPLTPSSVPEDVSLDALDTRLTGVMDLADKRQFGAAADRAEVLVEEGALDIRPISILLYDAFFQGGLAALSPILAVIANLVGPSVAAVGPTKRKESQFNLRLNWLFEEISTSLVWHDTKRSDDFERWIEGVRLETVDRTLAELSALMGQLTASSFAASVSHASKVADWLTGYRNILQKTALENAAAASARAGQASTGSPSGEGGQPAPSSSLAGDAPRPESLEPVRRSVEMVVSHAFLELLSKLKAFEKLVAKGELMKAALVSEEIETILQGFDPRSFFPEFFGPYCSLRSKNIEKLARYGADNDPIAWRAHAEYYKVDPKGFVGD